MKNELDLWEVGLAERVKGKEFSFDPQAFADFENLLQAESLGQADGAPAPAEPAGTMAAAGTTGLALPTSLLIISIVCLAGFFLWPRTAVVNEAVTTVAAPARTEIPAPESSPLTNPAPAPAPVSAQPPEKDSRATFPVKRTARGVSPAVGNENLPQATKPAPAQPTAGQSEVSRVRTATYKVAALPPAPIILSVQTPDLIPQLSIKVRKYTPRKRKRDRSTLFPDVID